MPTTVYVLLLYVTVSGILMVPTYSAPPAPDMFFGKLLQLLILKAIKYYIGVR